MKRKQLERHLRANGCRKLDEGGGHTRWVAADGSRSAVPRHREVHYPLARTICRQLGIPPPQGSR